MAELLAVVVSNIYTYTRMSPLRVRLMATNSISGRQRVHKGHSKASQKAILCKHTRVHIFI